VGARRDRGAGEEERVTVEIYTARIRYVGLDRFDITRKSGGPEGSVFAPSWKILGPALHAREDAERLRKQATQDLPLFSALALARDVRKDLTTQADDIERRAWATYAPLFLAEMDESERRHPDVWQRFRARPRVVLVCYCADVMRCHRSLLAQREAVRGATWAGEIGRDGRVTSSASSRSER
jgi:hypothetical protein